MINVNDLYEISSLLSDIFFYGLAYDYSSSSIEERIVKSEIAKCLEEGDSSLLFQKNPEEIVQDVYRLPEEVLFVAESNSLGEWLGEMYTKLFFKKNKSFSYLFLYLPLEEAINLFDLYHEMDGNQLLKRFEELEKKNTILSLLLKKKRIKIRELSALTNINVDTIISYTRSNSHIYNAKYQNIYSISSVLKINPNIFVERINNYTNSEMYSFDKTSPLYRLYLAYFLASYFDGDIAKTKYQLVDNTLVSKNDVLAVVWTEPIGGPLHSTNKNDEVLKAANEYKNSHKDISNTVLVIFEFNQISDEIDYYLPLKEYGFKKVLIINQMYFFSISSDRHLRREITDTINEASIRNAKEKVNGDFAV